MARTVARLAVALVASVLTAIYWWAVFLLVYADALFAGDRDPAATGDPDGLAGKLVTIALGIAVYAALSIGWRLLAEAFGRRRPFGTTGGRPH